MIFTDKITNTIRRMIADYLERWPHELAQTGGLPWSALPQPSEENPGFADAFHDHTQFYDAHKIWNRAIEAAVPETGDGLVWDGAQFAIGPVGGGGGNAFKAYLLADTELNPLTNITSFGDERYDTADVYDNAAFVWTPGAGPIMLIARTRLNTNVDITTAIVKNGTVVYLKSSGRYTRDGHAYTDFGWQDLADGDDHYELAITGDEGSLVASDTYWAGVSLAVSTGGGGGGGGGVPAPFMYLTDSDGYYLVDSDGRYLYEDL